MSEAARRSTVTRLLADEDLDADERSRRILPLVYDELRDIARQRMAGERNDHVLDATALVHEAYMRLLGSEVGWRDRGHFFAAAAEAMRRILIDYARKRDAERRGGGRQPLRLEGLEITLANDPIRHGVDLEALDRALTALEAESTRKATLVKLRYFTGLTLDECAAALDISPATADRDWSYAKAFLLHEVRRSDRS